MPEWVPLPDEVRLLIEENQRASAPAGDCLRCNAACCEVSGMAVLANVYAACELYERGWLSYQFTPGLEARGFAVTYFDTVMVTPADVPGVEPFLVFFPRSLVNGQTLICTSPVEDRDGKARALSLHEYEAVRQHHREVNSQYPWRCVFSSPDIHRREGAGQTFAGCLLHAEESGTHLTAKPLDCVFGVCHQPPALLPPGPEAAARWLAAVGRYCAAAGPQR